MNNPLRIAIITTGFSKDKTDYGGAAAFYNYVKELSLHDDIDVNVFAFYYPLNQPEYNFHNAKVYSFASGKTATRINKFSIWRKCEKKFASLHKLNKFDIIHSMWAGESGFVASRFSRKHNIPLIANIAGGELADFEEINYGSRTKQVQKYFVDKTFSKANVIVSGSDFINDKIKNYYDESILPKVKKLPFGVDDNIFTSFGSNTTADYNDETPVLINIANALPVKSHDTLFHAIKIVSQKFDSVHLECYGRDDNSTLKEIAEKYDVSGFVILKGFEDYENLPMVFNKKSIYVLSSLYESQNMSIIEAGFCGIPVVSTNVGVADEITEHLVTPGNYEMLAEKIINVIENYPDEKRKAAQRRETLVNKFSLKITTQNFINLYKSLLI